MNAKVALYGTDDDELTHYEVDIENASLTQRATVKVPANVHYTWLHPSRKYLYVAIGNRGAGLKADLNHVSAWRIDAQTGTLSQHGVPLPPPHRAVHICVSPDSKFVLSGHNLPSSGVTIPDQWRRHPGCSRAPAAAHRLRTATTGILTTEHAEHTEEIWKRVERQLVVKVGVDQHRRLVRQCLRTTIRRGARFINGALSSGNTHAGGRLKSRAGAGPPRLRLREWPW